MKQRIREGRVELCNAFFLEPTINLSGGEALVKMGVEGLRWQQQVMGVRPRLSWMIDVTGVHEQMAQIVAGPRPGRAGLLPAQPDRQHAALAGVARRHADAGHQPRPLPRMAADVWREDAAAEKQLQALADDIRPRIEPLPPDRTASGPTPRPEEPPRRTPAGAPVLIFGGSGDYSLAPLCKYYPG